MKKGFLTGNMLYDILVVGILTAVVAIITMTYVFDIGERVKDPDNYNMGKTFIVMLWTTFKLRKPK